MKRADYYDYRDNNDHDATMYIGIGGLDVIQDPAFYLPNGEDSSYGVPWYKWYLNPQDPLAEEPPDPVKKQFKLYRQISDTGNKKLQFQLMRQVLDIAAEQFFVLGLVSQEYRYGLVKNNFHNVPKLMPHAWIYPTPAPTNPSQYFMEP